MEPGLSAETISETRRVWAERTGEPLSPDDAAESIRNVAALFDLLAQWDTAEEDEPMRPGEEQ